MEVKVWLWKNSVFRIPKKFSITQLVITVALSGHALPDPLISEQLLVGLHLVLPTLIRMKDQMDVVIRYLLKSTLQHFNDLMKVWAFRQRETNDLTIE
jgi:hypothetical protein